MPPNGPTPAPARRFRIALSFPGEHRARVQAIAERLADTFPRDQILYDQWFDAEFARPNLDVYLPDLYHREADLLVVFLCADYEKKEWCRLEWRVVRDLLERMEDERIMLLRFDDTTIPGLLSIDGGPLHLGLEPLSARIRAAVRQSSEHPIMCRKEGPMTLTIDLRPEIGRGLLAKAQAKGVSLADFAQEVLTREAMPLEQKNGIRTGRELMEAGASVRGLFTDEEIDHLFSRTPSVSRPVDFS